MQRPISAITIILAGASLVILLAIGGAHLSPDPAYALLFDNLHWTVATFAAAVVAWIGYRRLQATESSSDRKARFWFALGLSSYAIGQILWNIQVYSGWNPFPSPADVFYILIGPCCALGFAAALRGHVSAVDQRSFYLDAAALSVGILAVALALYLPQHDAGGGLQMAVLIAYPFGLMGAACCGLILVLMTRPSADLSWVTLLASLVLSSLIWMSWNGQILDSMPAPGTLFNALFSVAGLMGGYGAANWRLRPSPNMAYTRIADMARYLLPLVLVLLACGAIILATVPPMMSATLRLAIDGTSLLVAVLAIIRQSFLLKERDTLLRAESAARRRVARFDQMQALIEDPIFVSRVEGDRFVYEELNPAALALLGRREEDAVGRYVDDVLGPKPAETVVAHYRRCAFSGEPIRYQVQFDGPDGPLWYDTLLLPVRGADGRVTHLHGLSRNVTALKAQTDKLERLAVDLDRARRDAESANRAKSMFLAKMSHELRTPLNAILGFAEVMDRQVFGPIGSERYQGYLKDIYASGRLLLLLVNDVLDLSKLEAGQYQLHEESVDLGEIAAETCAMLEQQAQSRGIRLASIRRPLPRVMADRRAIGQIVMNLVANGLKFTPQHGSVEVITDRGIDGAPQLVVRDTGTGIPKSEIHTVREAFVQGSGATQAAEAGTGLGLTIVCSMAELHGGAVVIDSEEGKGTTVTVRLPASRMLAA